MTQAIGQWLTRTRFLFGLLFLLSLVSPAHAVPSYDKLGAADDFGTVTASLVSSSSSAYTYRFAVKNTQPSGGYGIKGLLVYGPLQPKAMSQLDRCSETLYGPGGYSWWDFNGGPDYNNNGLADSYIEPGESVTDNTFTLTYSKAINLEDLRFGLHVVQPRTGCTFFVKADEEECCKPAICLEVSPILGCVSSPGQAVFTYKVTNKGKKPLTQIKFDDWFENWPGATLSGDFSAPLNPGSWRTFTRKVPLNTSACLLVNVVKVCAYSAACKETVSDCGGSLLKIIHPSLSIEKTASAPGVAAGTSICVPAGTDVTYTFTVKNTGDVTLENIVVKDSINGAPGVVVGGSGFTLAPGCSKTLTLTTTNVQEDVCDQATVTAKDDCGCGTVSATSAKVCVEVKRRTEATPISPQVVCEGNNAVFETTASGDGPFTFAWTRDGSPVSPGGRFTITNTATTSKLVIADTVPGDSGEYSVLVTGANGSVTRSAELTVNPKPTVNAGPDQVKASNSAVTQFTLAGQAANGVPVWSLVSGDAVVADPGALNSGVTVNGYGVVELRLTVTSTSCGTVTDTVTLQVVPVAEINGRVVCAQSGSGIQALVQLKKDGVVVDETTTDASGVYQFPTSNAVTLVDGSYTVVASNPVDFAAPVSQAISYASAGPDVTVPNIGLQPLPVVDGRVEALSGRVFFSASAGFAGRATTGIIIQGPAVPSQDLGDPNLGQLVNPAFISADFSVSYRYYGYIPGFPELGLFDANRPLYVIMERPLVSGNVWGPGSTSFRNMVQVSDALTGQPPVAGGSYTIRVLFSHPFAGMSTPHGTARDYTITGLDVTETQGVLGNPTWKRLPAVQWTAPAAAGSPLLTDVPSGWMAQTQYEFRQQAGLGFVIYADGFFKTACGGQTLFHIHPEGGAAPLFED